MIKNVYILPLESKYYETKVVVEFENEDYANINITCNSIHPSTRELEMGVPEPGDNHFEGEKAYQMAQLILRQLSHKNDLVVEEQSRGFDEYGHYGENNPPVGEFK